SAGTTASDTASLSVTTVDPAPTLIALPPPSANRFAFGLLGDQGRRYRIQSSTNLADWLAEAAFPAAVFQDAPTNNLKSVIFDSSGADPFSLRLAGHQRFFRATPFHAANEICNNNIKQIRFA